MALPCQNGTAPAETVVEPETEERGDENDDLWSDEEEGECAHGDMDYDSNEDDDEEECPDSPPPNHLDQMPSTSSASTTVSDNQIPSTSSASTIVASIDQMPSTSSTTAVSDTNGMENGMPLLFSLVHVDPPTAQPPIDPFQAPLPQMSVGEYLKMAETERKRLEAEMNRIQDERGREGRRELEEMMRKKKEERLKKEEEEKEMKRKEEEEMEKRRKEEEEKNNKEKEERDRRAHESEQNEADRRLKLIEEKKKKNEERKRQKQEEEKRKRDEEQELYQRNRAEAREAMGSLFAVTSSPREVRRVSEAREVTEATAVSDREVEKDDDAMSNRSSAPSGHSGSASSKSEETVQRMKEAQRKRREREKEMKEKEKNAAREDTRSPIGEGNIPLDPKAEKKRKKQEEAARVKERKQREEEEKIRKRREDTAAREAQNAWEKIQAKENRKNATEQRLKKAKEREEAERKKNEGEKGEENEEEEKKKKEEKLKREEEERKKKDAEEKRRKEEELAAVEREKQQRKEKEEKEKKERERKEKEKKEKEERERKEKEEKEKEEKKREEERRKEKELEEAVRLEREKKEKKKEDEERRRDEEKRKEREAGKERRDRKRREEEEQEEMDSSETSDDERKNKRKKKRRERKEEARRRQSHESSEEEERKKRKKRIESSSSSDEEMPSSSHRKNSSASSSSHPPTAAVHYPTPAARGGDAAAAASKVPRVRQKASHQLPPNRFEKEREEAGVLNWADREAVKMVGKIPKKKKVEEDPKMTQKTCLVGPRPNQGHASFLPVPLGGVFTPASRPTPVAMQRQQAATNVNAAAISAMRRSTTEGEKEEKRPSTVKRPRDQLKNPLGGTDNTVFPLDKVQEEMDNVARSSSNSLEIPPEKRARMEAARMEREQGYVRSPAYSTGGASPAIVSPLYANSPTLSSSSRDSPLCSPRDNDGIRGGARPMQQQQHLQPSNPPRNSAAAAHLPPPTAKDHRTVSFDLENRAAHKSATAPIVPPTAATTTQPQHPVHRPPVAPPTSSTARPEPTAEALSAPTEQRRNFMPDLSNTSRQSLAPATHSERHTEESSIADSPAAATGSVQPPATRAAVPLQDPRMRPQQLPPAAPAAAEPSTPPPSSDSGRRVALDLMKNVEILTKKIDEDPVAMKRILKAALPPTKPPMFVEYYGNDDPRMPTNVKKPSARWDLLEERVMRWEEKEESRLRRHPSDSIVPKRRMIDIQEEISKERRLGAFLKCTTGEKYQREGCRDKKDKGRTEMIGLEFRPGSRARYTTCRCPPCVHDGSDKNEKSSEGLAPDPTKDQHNDDPKQKETPLITIPRLPHGDGADPRSANVSLQPGIDDGVMVPAKKKEWAMKQPQDNDKAPIPTDEFRAVAAKFNRLYAAGEKRAKQIEENGEENENIEMLSMRLIKGLGDPKRQMEAKNDFDFVARMAGLPSERIEKREEGLARRKERTEGNGQSPSASDPTTSSNVSTRTLDQRSGGSIAAAKIARIKKINEEFHRERNNSLKSDPATAAQLATLASANATRVLKSSTSSRPIDPRRQRSRDATASPAKTTPASVAPPIQTSAQSLSSNEENQPAPVGGAAAAAAASATPAAVVDAAKAIAKAKETELENYTFEMTLAAIQKNAAAAQGCLPPPPPFGLSKPAMMSAGGSPFKNAPPPKTFTYFPRPLVPPILPATPSMATLLAQGAIASPQVPPTYQGLPPPVPYRAIPPPPAAFQQPLLQVPIPQQQTPPPQPSRPTPTHPPASASSTSSTTSEEASDQRNLNAEQPDEPSTSRMEKDVEIEKEMEQQPGPSNARSDPPQDNGGSRGDDGDDDEAIALGMVERGFPFTKQPSWPKTTYEQNARTVIIYKFRKDTTDDQLRNHFSQFGKIEDIRVNFGSMNLRNYALIRFAKMTVVRTVAASTHTFPQGDFVMEAMTYLQ